MKTRLFIGVATMVAAVVLSGCAYDTAGYDTGYPSYNGGQYGASGVGGSGAQYLDPWLSGTQVGQTLVLRRFDGNHNGQIKEGTARKANAWFRRYADSNRDQILTDQEINMGLERLSRDYRYY